MLPNLKFLVCGILFCVLLFAVTGAGVMLPDSRTHIGEMPEVGRPMMQRSMAEVPDRAQAYMTTAARRSEELERLRELVPVEEPAQPEPDLPNPDLPKPDLPQPDLPKPDVVASAVSDGDKPADSTPDNSPREGAATSVHSPSVPPEETRSEDRMEAGPPRQVAVLTPAGGEEGEPTPRLVNVPLPTPRPTALNGLGRLGNIPRHRHRLAQRHDTAIQGLAVPSNQAAPLTPGGVAAGYTPSEAARR
jgi:hypothetical protein